MSLVNSAHTESAVASAAVNEACEAFEAEAAFVVVTRPGYGERETIGQIGLTIEQAATISANGLCGAALGTARAQVHSGDDLLGVGMRRVALAPWTAHHGRQLVVGVARRYDEPFDPPELALLEAVADAVGHGLERAWLGEERDRHAARQAALARAARSLSASLITGEVLQTLSAEVSQAFEADVVLVYLSDDQGGMRVVAGAGLPAAALDLRSASGGLIGCVRAAGEARVSQPFDGEAPVALPGLPELRSGLAAPIRPRRDVEGVVLVGYHGDRWIAGGDVELLSAFADLAGIAQRNADDHAAARRAASLDSLTGCLNHGAFQSRLREEITRAERSESALTLVLVDLNDFKAANDRFGHPIGDAVLCGVADGLRSAVRVYDRVARYGGDEFAILLPAIEEATARSVVDRALGALGEVKLPDGTAVSATAGLAHWRAGDRRRADSPCGSGAAPAQARPPARRKRGPERRGRARAGAGRATRTPPVAPAGDRRRARRTAGATPRSARHRRNGDHPAGRGARV